MESMAPDHEERLIHEVNDDKEEFLSEAEVTNVPYNFDLLTADDIYDVFVNGKENKSGFCARYVFTQLAKHKDSPHPPFGTIPSTVNWVEELGSKLQASKKGQKKQRAVFVELCNEYGFLDGVRSLCKAHYSDKLVKQKRAEDLHEGQITLRGIDKSLCARIVHLAVEEDSKEILVEIFSVRENRELLDDKVVRVGELWKFVGDRFFNDPMWNLQYFDPTRTGNAGTDFLDPSIPPLAGKEWSFEKIQAVFNKVKTLYTRCYDMWNSSGQQVGGGDPQLEDFLDSDTDFYENFAEPNFQEEARLLYYCHLLWGRAPPSFVLRTTKPSQQRQIGVEGTNINNAHTGLLAGSTSKKKREIESLTSFAHTLSEAFSVKETDEEKVIRTKALLAQSERDTEIKRHYALLNDELESKKKKFKFSFGTFENIEAMLAAAHLSPTEIAHCAAVLREASYNTPFSLTQVNLQVLQQLQIPQGLAMSILAVVRNTDSGFAL
jgi:hypothetical protein